MEKLQSELASMRARAETLSNRYAAADVAFVDAKAKLQRHHLEADLDADEKAGAKLEAAVAAAALKRDGLADVLGEVRKMIAAAEASIADERAAIERKAAAEKLAHDLDEIERALPAYLRAAAGFADALESISFETFEASQMATFVRNGQAQIEVAAAFVLQELRGMVTAIHDGVAPIPAPKPAPEPVVMTEPAPETRRVFAMRAVKWKDAEGRQCFGQQFEDVDLTPAAASRGLRCAAVVLINDERRQRLHGARGGHHVNKNALDLIDLDDEQATRPPHIDPIMASSEPVLRAANFREIDRSAESRVLKISVPRL